MTMRFSSLSIGCVSLLLLPAGAYAIGMGTLYDEMRMMTEYDQQDFVSELPIQRFAPLVLGDEKFPAEEK
ncbi:MAG: hypothetical protein PHO92_03925, partial [Candidatus Peribacteraceae bacterium]|nr:hypothetical protein [Candidatus Peribacteraceae bacterium]